MTDVPFGTDKFVKSFYVSVSIIILFRIRQFEDVYGPGRAWTAVQNLIVSSTAVQLPTPDSWGEGEKGSDCSQDPEAQLHSPLESEIGL